LLSIAINPDGGKEVETGMTMTALGAVDARVDLSLAPGWLLAVQADAQTVHMVSAEKEPELPLRRAWAGGYLGAGLRRPGAPQRSPEPGCCSRLPAFGGILTPYSSAELAGGGPSSYSAGARFKVDRAVEVSAEGTHRQPATGDAEQFLTLRARLRQ
jgi:hypothetical protein